MKCLKNVLKQAIPFGQQYNQKRSCMKLIHGK
uniref:Uncharacterized protein n=1 Tax=Anguilla anguilla TaxID=7936 RepID=A0A0E9VMU3_ANGAN